MRAILTDVENLETRGESERRGELKTTLRGVNRV